MNSAIDLSTMRENYNSGVLLEESAANNPFTQFEAWLLEAINSQEIEPNAMTLATVGGDLRPSTRVVLLKGLSAEGLFWATHYCSRKGLDLASNPFAALQFYWPILQRVVRIEGMVEKVSATESDTYFAQRPLASRISAIASPQSWPVDNRKALELAWQDVQKKHTDQTPPPRPQDWGGYRLKPEQWEFWQGRSHRLHDRLLYRKHAPDTWHINRLAP